MFRVNSCVGSLGFDCVYQKLVIFGSFRMRDRVLELSVQDEVLSCGSRTRRSIEEKNSEAYFLYSGKVHQTSGVGLEDTVKIAC